MFDVTKWSDLPASSLQESPKCRKLHVQQPADHWALRLQRLHYELPHLLLFLSQRIQQLLMLCQEVQLLLLYIQKGLALSFLGLLVPLQLCCLRILSIREPLCQGCQDLSIIRIKCCLQVSCQGLLIQQLLCCGAELSFED